MRKNVRCSFYDSTIHTIKCITTLASFMVRKEPIKLDGSNSASSTTGSSHNGETETDRNSDGNPALSKTGESEISDEEDEAGWESLKSWYDANPESDERPSLQYPVGIIFEFEE